MPNSSPRPLERAAGPANARRLSLLLALTALTSAWLLFQVQPMVAKRLLPWFGGGASIWTTAMLFFQTGLLGGYLYAHLVAKRLPPRTQINLHIGLLVAAIAVVIALGVVPSAAWIPANNAVPALRILVILAACVGLPYLALAATAPLVQVWFARANPGTSPYRLYALSNAGSLGALISYPLLVEPNIGLARQGLLWSALFIAFAILCALSGLAAANVPTTDADADPPIGASNVPSELAPSPSRLTTFFWLALPACGSLALLAVTAHLCQDVAPIPLLWILPMVVYLVSFILTFDSDRWYRRWLWYAVLAAGSFFAVFGWHNAHLLHLPVQVAAHLILLLGITMVCHGELARMRPAPNRLTTFYLCISAGGALGGLLAGVVAPLVLKSNLELPIAILAAWLLAIAILVTDRDSKFYDGRAFYPLMGVAALLLALVVSMGVYFYKLHAQTIARARNFYGALKVQEFDADKPEITSRKLANGRISHGEQFTFSPNRRVPTSYFYTGSGIGQLLSLGHDTPRRVGVIGLGVGTLAAYADAGDSYTFYEINPQDVKFAEEYFTYLSDARDRLANVEIIEGDARLSLEREQPRNYDALVIDAFSGDAIPAHLLTREAFAIYMRHLREPYGVLAVHISNLYVDLAPVVAAAAEEFNLEGRFIDAEGDNQAARTSSVWVLLARPAAKISGGVPLQEALAGAKPVAWTDDHNDLISLLK